MTDDLKKGIAAGRGKPSTDAPRLRADVELASLRREVRRITDSRRKLLFEQRRIRNRIDAIKAGRPLNDAS